MTLPPFFNNVAMDLTNITQLVLQAGSIVVTIMWAFTRVRDEMLRELQAQRLEIAKLSTQMIGVDGHNGMRGDMQLIRRELHEITGFVHAVETRVTRLESNHPHQVSTSRG